MAIVVSISIGSGLPAFAGVVYRDFNFEALLSLDASRELLAPRSDNLDTQDARNVRPRVEGVRLRPGAWALRRREYDHSETYYLPNGSTVWLPSDGAPARLVHEPNKVNGRLSSVRTPRGIAIERTEYDGAVTRLFVASRNAERSTPDGRIVALRRDEVAELVAQIAPSPNWVPPNFPIQFRFPTQAPSREISANFTTTAPLARPLTFDIPSYTPSSQAFAPHVYADAVRGQLSMKENTGIKAEWRFAHDFAIIGSIAIGQETPQSLQVGEPPSISCKTDIFSPPLANRGSQIADPVRCAPRDNVIPVPTDDVCKQICLAVCRAEQGNAACSFCSQLPVSCKVDVQLLSDHVVEMLGKFKSPRFILDTFLGDTLQRFIVPPDMSTGTFDIAPFEYIDRTLASFITVLRVSAHVCFAEGIPVLGGICFINQTLDDILLTHPFDGELDLPFNIEQPAPLPRPLDCFDLSTGVVPRGSGSVTLDQPTDFDCGSKHGEGKLIFATARPNLNYIFSHWEGDVAGETSVIPIAMDGSKSITAVFEVDVRTPVPSTMPTPTPVDVPTMPGTATASPTSTSTPRSGQFSLAYYALGDSVAAGHGLPLGGRTIFPANCRQSSLAYPHSVHMVLAGFLSGRFNVLPLRHLACSGATSIDQSPPIPVDFPEQTDQLVREAQSFPEGQVTLVSITIGANDFEFDDEALLGSNLCSSPRRFQTWRSGTSRLLSRRLDSQLRRILAIPNTYVVVTDYFNPFNRTSRYFDVMKGPPNVKGIPNPRCRHSQFSDELLFGRTELVTEALNAAVLKAVVSGGSLGRVTIASVREAFRGRESARQNCGGSTPDPMRTWIQYPQEDVGSLAEQLTLLEGDDCFHPNQAGAIIYAFAVLAGAAQLLP